MKWSFFLKRKNEIQAQLMPFMKELFGTGFKVKFVRMDNAGENEILQTMIKNEYSGIKIEKTVTIGGKAETKIIEKADFEKELALFLASDINKPAWRDKYRIEKTAGRSLESFLAKDDDLKTKRLDIYRFPPNGVTQILIVNSDKSSVTESQQNLDYDIGKGYSIETFQQFFGSDSSKIRIDVLFLK